VRSLTITRSGRTASAVERNRSITEKREDQNGALPQPTKHELAGSHETKKVRFTAFWLLNHSPASPLSCVLPRGRAHPWHPCNSSFALSLIPRLRSQKEADQILRGLRVLFRSGLWLRIIITHWCRRPD